MLGIADNCIAGSIRVIRFTSKTLYIHDIHHSLFLNSLDNISLIMLKF